MNTPNGQFSTSLSNGEQTSPNWQELQLLSPVNENSLDPISLSEKENTTELSTENQNCPSESSTVLLGDSHPKTKRKLLTRCRSGLKQLLRPLHPLRHSFSFRRPFDDISMRSVLKPRLSSDRQSLQSQCISELVAQYGDLRDEVVEMRRQMSYLQQAVSGLRDSLKASRSTSVVGPSDIARNSPMLLSADQLSSAKSPIDSVLTQSETLMTTTDEIPNDGGGRPATQSPMFASADVNPRNQQSTKTRRIQSTASGPDVVPPRLPIWPAEPIFNHQCPSLSPSNSKEPSSSVEPHQAVGVSYTPLSANSPLRLELQRPAEVDQVPSKSDLLNTSADHPSVVPTSQSEQLTMITNYSNRSGKQPITTANTDCCLFPASSPSVSEVTGGDSSELTCGGSTSTGAHIVVISPSTEPLTQSVKATLNWYGVDRCSLSHSLLGKASPKFSELSYAEMKPGMAILSASATVPLAGTNQGGCQKSRDSASTDVPCKAYPRSSASSVRENRTSVDALPGQSSCAKATLDDRSTSDDNDDGGEVPNASGLVSSDLSLMKVGWQQSHLNTDQPLLLTQSIRGLDVSTLQTRVRQQLQQYSVSQQVVGEMTSDTGLCATASTDDSPLVDRHDWPLLPACPCTVRSNDLERTCPSSTIVTPLESDSEATLSPLFTRRPRISTPKVSQPHVGGEIEKTGHFCDKTEAILAPVDSSGDQSSLGSVDSHPSVSSSLLLTARRKRVLVVGGATLSLAQKLGLLSAFRRQPHPSWSRLHALSRELGLAQRTVISWFRTHRMHRRHSQTLVQTIPRGDVYPPLNGANQRQHRLVTTDNDGSAIPTGLRSSTADETGRVLSLSLPREPPVQCD